MQGAGSTVVAGVQGGEEFADLGPAHLADHKPVRAHAEGLPHQFADGHLADALDVGGPGHQADYLGVAGLEFAGVFHADDSLVVGDAAEQGGQQRGLAGAGAADDQEGQSGRGRSR